MVEQTPKNKILWKNLRVGQRKIWLIADCHWNQRDNEPLGRGDGWQESIRKAWKQRVGPRDLVLDLGDVVMSHVGMLDDIVCPLPGIKILVRGNHDNEPLSWYMDKGYACVVDQLVLGPETLAIYDKHGGRTEVQNNSRILFNHRPLEVLPANISFCVHGHLHANPLSDYYKKVLSKYNELFVLERHKGPVLLEDWLKECNRLE